MLVQSNMPKILLVFYSRTGTTKKAAQFIGGKISCDIEEIIDPADRSGAIGWLRCGREATLKTLPEINPISKKPADYNLVIIGTPIWSYNMASPVRTFLTQNKDRFKKVAFFCTMGGSGSERAFGDMETICRQPPLATLALLSGKVWGILKRDVTDKEQISEIENFTEKIIKPQ